MVQAIIWETLQCLRSVFTAESGRIIGDEMHKVRIVEKTGDEGRKGAMRRPNWQSSCINLSKTLFNCTMGGKRYKLPDQGKEKASTNSAPGSGKREEYLGK